MGFTSSLPEIQNDVEGKKKENCFPTAVLPFPSLHFQTLQWWIILPVRHSSTSLGGCQATDTCSTLQLVGHFEGITSALGQKATIDWSVVFAWERNFSLTSRYTLFYSLSQVYPCFCLSLSILRYFSPMKFNQGWLSSALFFYPFSYTGFHQDYFFMVLPVCSALHFIHAFWISVPNRRRT